MAAATTAKAKGSGGKTKKAPTQTQYITTLALIMMNVTIVAGIGNDVQLAFYGLSSVTYLIIGAVLFFLPTGLVAAELASGWGERGGIFRWVGEGLGMFPAISCLLILWFQTVINFGSGIPSSAVTIGFFTPDLDWAIKFAEESHPAALVLGIMCCWLVYYYFINWLATRGVKTFAKLTKYGVLIGTFIPLAVMIVLACVWLLTGHKVAFLEDPATASLIPQWSGMSTLALAAGVFFSFAGIDMNAAYIKDLKHPSKQYPTAIFVAMILSLIIFIVGTLIIAMVIPESQLNLLYTLNVVLADLGSLIGMPWLYLVFVYLGLANSFASMITNLAGPSYMLGGAGRSGFLPKALQNNNKHGMPSRLMWLMMFVMTAIGFLVFLLPNVEGFVALVDQALTVLYMIYYIFMFVAFIKLRYEQPNRPRSFKVPGGMVGAWIVTIVGLASCVFASVLAIYPPAQLSAEVGSPVTYVAIVVGLVVGVMLCCFVIYKVSRKHGYIDAEHTGWVDPTNAFAPFTWQVEGYDKPTKVLSNVPSEVLAEGQNPMGMPIKHKWDGNYQIPIHEGKGKGAAEKYAEELAAYVHEHRPEPLPKPIHMTGMPGTDIAGNGVKTAVDEASEAKVIAAPPRAKTPAIVIQNPIPGLKNIHGPNVPAELVDEQLIPGDPAKLEAALKGQKLAMDKKVESDLEQDQALADEIAADEKLVAAENAVKTAEAEEAAAKKAVPAPATNPAPAAKPADTKPTDSSAKK